MQDAMTMILPRGEYDKQGAERVFSDFFALYQPTLVRVEQHLKEIVESIEPERAEIYRPWLLSLRDLIRGVYLTTRKISVPSPEAFTDAVKAFSFRDAIAFLEKLCAHCRLALSRDWGEHFREHINALLFSAAILNNRKMALAHISA